MVRNNKRLKRKSGRRRRPIQDINHNHTNITIDFWKVLPLNLVSTPSGSAIALRLSPQVAQITQDLAQIYKLYRFTSVKLVFQANQTTSLDNNLAINYIPAADALPSPPPATVEEFEGPAVGFYTGGRGTPYHYKVPSQVLNAMNYNFYETKNGDPADLIQGVFYFLNTDTDPTIPIYAYAHFTVEFQTLEDPSFLTAKMREVAIPNRRNKMQRAYSRSQTKRSIDGEPHEWETVSTVHL